MANEQFRSVLVVVHPLLFAVWPMLDLYARHATEVPARDLLIPLTLVFVTAAALLVLLQLLLKDADRAGIFVSCAVLPFFLYGATAQLIANSVMQFGLQVVSGGSAWTFHCILQLALLAAVGLLYRIVLRTNRPLAAVTKIANLAAVVLVLFALLRIVGGEVSYWTHTSIRSTKGVRQSESLPAQTADEPQLTPDIYFLVFDRYANSATLTSAYRFDNRPFLSSLESRGFFVADKSRCNYAMTLLSLASTLNMRFHESMVGTDTIERDLSSRFEVGTILKELGYRIIDGRKIFDWDLSSAAAPSDDDFLKFDTWTDAANPSSFDLAVAAMTPVGPFIVPKAAAKRHAREIRRQFQMVQAAAAEPGPKFVLAHFLLPHPPFAFRERGLRPWHEAPSGSKQAYVEQLKYTNRKIEELVDFILKNSPTPPIIVLQSDEGPYLREDDAAASKTQQRRIRTGILNAFYLPGQSVQDVSPAISAVNTFRLILQKYFAYELELLEDSVFVWPFADGGRQPAITLHREDCGIDFPGKASRRRFEFKDVSHELTAVVQ